ncbi:MAG TPA: FUSC family protein, partial [Polyangia bacterium]|nr:FUSC family protein [Polyangia bacterium]
MHTHVREVLRLSAARPALALGARTALATVLPLSLASVIGDGAATWASLMGFSVALADKGGAYPTRFATMSAVMLGGAAAALIGSLVGTHAIGSVVAMALVTALCGFTGVWGPAAAGVGSSIAVMFAVAVAWPLGTLDLALVRSLAMLGGGAWALLLALVFWPVRVYKPARYAVAAAFRRLADQVATRTGPGGHGRVRDAIENARAVLAATRRGRRGESGRGERLLVLSQIVDLAFGSLVAIEDVLDGGDAELDAAIERELTAMSATLVQLARDIETEARVQKPAPLAWGGERLRQMAAGLPTARRVQVEHAAAIVSNLASLVTMARELTATLHDDAAPATVSPLVPGPMPPRPSRWEPLRENLDWSSPLLRHALRLAVLSATAVLFVRWLALQRGYWVTLTVIILLQPYAPATVTKALQRVAGTVAGGILAALIGSVVHDARGILVLAFVLAGLSAAVLQINYALYSFLLTPTFVLLAEVHANDWSLARLRILNTIAGGVLAFAGASLWPSREGTRFTESLAAALAATRAYFACVMAVVAGADPAPSPRLSAARRRFGLRCNEADGSLQRLIAESRARPEAIEPLMTLVLYVRRFGASMGALASARAMLPPTTLARL